MRKWFLVVLFLGLLSCGGEDETELSGEGSNNSGVSENGVEAVSGPVRDWFRSEVDFVRIKSGWFMMGSPENELYRQRDENGKDGKRVRVEITRSFEMMATEMTQALYERVMRKNPSRFKDEGDCDNWDSVKRMCPDNPVERVSWKDAQEFIGKLNASIGLELEGCNGRPSDPSGCYRLPTEAEWEYALRAGSETAYFYGDDASQLGRYAIYSGNSGGRTHRVKGDRLPNRNGLYDMSGSVWEWVDDAWQDYLLGGKDPLVTTGSYRVLRGGSWYIVAEGLRSANRSRYHPSLWINFAKDLHSVFRYGLLPGNGDFDIGFRLVRNL